VISAGLGDDRPPSIPVDPSIAREKTVTHRFAFAGLLMALTLSTSATAMPEQAAAPAPADPRAIVVERSVKHDYQATLDAMRQQLKADGWKLIAEIDLGKRLEKKGVEIPGGLVIFKLTSGKNAVPLLAADETRYVSAMMPCGLSVYGKSDGSVVISRMNFEMMGAMMEPAVAAVMERSIAKLNRTVDAALAKLAGN